MDELEKYQSCGYPEDVPQSGERRFGTRYRGIRHSYVKTEENMPIHVIPDGGERVRLNEISGKSSDIMYLKKNADADTSA